MLRHRVFPYRGGALLVFASMVDAGAPFSLSTVARVSPIWTANTVNDRTANSNETMGQNLAPSIAGRRRDRYAGSRQPLGGVCSGGLAILVGVICLRIIAFHSS
jgi:hypothetical protein